MTGREAAEQQELENRQAQRRAEISAAASSAAEALQDSDRERRRIVVEDAVDAYFDSDGYPEPPPGYQPDGTS
jgi:hypothetical protein